MDINLPSDLNSPRPSTTPRGDLLAQLRAAGTIEAEVIKVLKDNLLLRSSLGEILTRNTLNYQPGDRLYLRLDERGPAPVLKSSPAESRPVSIDIRSNPELADLLPRERPVLTQVLRVIAQQAEVRLAQALIKLPPQVNARRGDLLRLARNDSRQQIEITPLQTKAIYKALIKHLVPATRDNGRTSLVRLFDLIARAAGEVRPRATDASQPPPQKPSIPAQSATRSEAAPVRSPDNPARSAPRSEATPARSAGKPATATPATATPVKSEAGKSAPPTPGSVVPKPEARNPVQVPDARARLAAATAAIARPIPASRAHGSVPIAPPKIPATALAERSAARLRADQGGAAAKRTSATETAAPGTRAIRISQSGANSIAAAKTDPGPIVRGSQPGTEPASVKTAPAPRDQGPAPSDARQRPPAAPAPQTGQLQSAPRSNPAPTPAMPTPQAGQSNSTPPAGPPAASISMTSSSPAAPAASLFDRGPSMPAADGETAPLLKLLTRLLPRLPQLDAASLQRWFQAAKLVEAPARQASPSIDIMRILARLGDGDGFARELGNLPGAESRTRTEAESQAARIPPEAPAAQIREGLKLVEQSLVQNLLQRASIGLQQETQQPLAFNLALPLLEHNEIKPLYIDLAQRNRAQQPNEQCWDIRIRFEFAALGPVCCHIVLEGNAVAASFYSERAATRENIDSALPALRRQLNDAGFEAGDFHSFSGGFEVDRSPLAADIGEALIDIEV